MLALVLSSCGLGSDKASYAFGKVTKGDMETTVTSSGFLEPLTVIDVGTQVSGTITEVYVDYNDKVKKGQLLAVLDTFLLKISVNEALSNLAKNNAAFEQADTEYKRQKSLHDQKLISDQEMLPYDINLKTQKANKSLAQMSYKKARRNLGYAYIKSPVDGVVIAKEVEAGQTVASSLSSPTLFTVAQDLKDMQILAEVDESDIGLIKEGMNVRFEVQAYPDKIYTGVVKQVRLQSVDVSNVVNYTVVVSALNEDLTLFPGMTATVNFILSVKKDVFLIPSMATRFKAPEELQEKLKANREKRQADASSKGKVEGTKKGAKKGNKKAGASKRTLIWYSNDKGEINAFPVTTGDNSSGKTEISSDSPILKEGLKIITKSVTVTSSSKKQLTSESSGPGEGGGGGGPGGPHGL